MVTKVFAHQTMLTRAGPKLQLHAEQYTGVDRTLFTGCSIWKHLESCWYGPGFRAKPKACEPCQCVQYCNIIVVALVYLLVAASVYVYIDYSDSAIWISI